ncbi:VWA domain-containing protein [Sporosarcina sp. ANT_H38]|uniref:VWA domain-containing protein n=1 Tax=Sporosarcina sp. ANT_H38 TaxID=2597358 RepID=UPI0011F35BF8|nr:VWA domain-containing protein [Sporosarcina sp. ANT_H38]KAA0965999.1 VWA domain-containing protein [Sporosarcina sp. ANT_H38]
MGNLIDLTKKAGIVLEKKNLNGVKAEIVLVIDQSGSMRTLYKNGTVQELVERLLAIGMNMDANKEIDVFQFNQGSNYVGVATEANHATFVKDNNMGVSGTTKYAPVMEDVVAKYGIALNVDQEPVTKSLLGGLFNKKKVEVPKKPAYPTFVLFITDGNNSDKREATRIVRESSTQPIFWQFVGIGKEEFTFLQKLDDLKDRHVDNADFFKVDDIMNITDEELYDKLLTEFPDWLSEIKAKDMLAL